MKSTSQQCGVRLGIETKDPNDIAVRKLRIRKITEDGRPPVGTSAEVQRTRERIELVRVETPLVVSFSKSNLIHN